MAHESELIRVIEEETPIDMPEHEYLQFLSDVQYGVKALRKPIRSRLMIVEDPLTMVRKWTVLSEPRLIEYPMLIE